jgi:hypothetical protein
VRERSWRCDAPGCADYLTLDSARKDGVLYLGVYWDQPCTLRERLRRIWLLLTWRQDDWYEHVVSDPAVAREMAAWLSAGAVALEQED